jgi:predicted RNA binding protein YcfA (HicA-like mRNA interferase family)
MKYPKNVWDQIKAITAKDLIIALEKDKWIKDTHCRQSFAYYNPANKKRVTIHYHPGKTYGPKTLRLLIDAIGWSVNDLKRLNLVK